MQGSRGPARHPDTEILVLDGIIYRRRKGKRYYQTMLYDKRAKKLYCESYHRALWKKHFGPIPEGYHIHHKDGDWNNNTIENLECLSHKEHFGKHSETFSKSPALRRHLGRIRILALQATLDKWEGATYRMYTCKWCGAKFKSRCADRKWPKYCPGTKTECYNSRAAERHKPRSQQVRRACLRSNRKRRARVLCQ